MSDAALFITQLGACCQQVHPDVQAPFDTDALPVQPVYYEDTMTQELHAHASAPH